MAKKISKPDMDRIKAAVAATFGGPHRRKKAVGAGVCAAVLVAGLGIACATVAAPPQAEAEVQEEGRIVPVDVVLPSTEDGNRDLSSDAVASRAESLFFDGEALFLAAAPTTGAPSASVGSVTITWPSLTSIEIASASTASASPSKARSAQSARTSSTVSSPVSGKGAAPSCPASPSSAAGENAPTP